MHFVSQNSKISVRLHVLSFCYLPKLPCLSPAISFMKLPILST